MTRDEKLSLLRKWQERGLALDAQWSEFAKATGAATDSPLGDAIWRVWQEYTDTLSDLLDDDFALQWHWYCNDFGRKGLIYLYRTGGHYLSQTCAICTVEDLLRMMEEGKQS